MDNKKGEEEPKANPVNNANKLPAEIVGRFLQNLSVGDRLKNERVSPRWKRALSKWGWTEQRKLDADIVFEGANEKESVVKFREGEHCPHFRPLLRWCASWLRELDLPSFVFEMGNIAVFLPQIAELLESLEKLEKLDIRESHFPDFVHYLPPNLRVLKTTGRFRIETLEVLADRCPQLEEVPFRGVSDEDSLDIENLVKLIGKFSRQRKLDLISDPYFKLRSEKVGTLAPFGQLEALEELKLGSYTALECFDGASLEAIIRGCQRLRSLSFYTLKLNEGELFQLGKIKNLTALEVFDRKGEFSDAVLKTIANRGQLKKLVVCSCLDPEERSPLTDNSIIYLVDRCKITERSLEAIVAEIQRRHGWPPRAHGWPPQTLPMDPLDQRIFYLRIYNVGFEEERARELIGDPFSANPWLKLDHDPRKN